MGFLGRLFGKAVETVKPAIPAQVMNVVAPDGKEIPPERVGLNGEYDESGLAKRVAAAFDDQNLPDDGQLWVAQTGSKVVLRYNPSAESILDQAKKIAMSVDGAGSVVAEPNS
ncbi:MAG: hypothetical protein F6J87_00515 [Spirulina sp. SIO3F2]|nr:hypothetical protein [Spirulina sp. SIO3F2]